jgi:hypothetical protein
MNIHDLYRSGLTNLADRIDRGLYVPESVVAALLIGDLRQAQRLFEKYEQSRADDLRQLGLAA